MSGPPSLVAFEAPLPLGRGAAAAGEAGAAVVPPRPRPAAGDAKALQTQTDEILNSILPPRYVPIVPCDHGGFRPNRSSCCAFRSVSTSLHLALTFTRARFRSRASIWEGGDGENYIQYTSKAPATRLDLVNLQVCLVGVVFSTLGGLECQAS
jgi:hypothetical protein